jgi:hypothetical protein
MSKLVPMRAAYILLLAVAIPGPCVIDLALAAPGSEAGERLASRDGGFSSTCTSESIDNWTLKASCLDINSNKVSSEVLLDRCLGNGAGGFVVCESK